MKTNKLAINWQNFAQVQLQLKFAFVVQHFVTLADKAKTRILPVITMILILMQNTVIQTHSQGGWHPNRNVASIC